MKDREFFRLVDRAKLLIEREDDGIADMLEEENPGIFARENWIIPAKEISW